MTRAELRALLARRRAEVEEAKTLLGGMRLAYGHHYGAGTAGAELPREALWLAIGGLAPVLKKYEDILADRTWTAGVGFHDGACPEYEAARIEEACKAALLDPWAEFLRRYGRLKEWVQGLVTPGAAPLLDLTLDRAEGLTAECSAETFAGPDAVDRAQRALIAWSLTAPSPGRGYPKVYVTARYEDGAVHRTRYDLTRPGGIRRGPTLRSLLP